MHLRRGKIHSTEFRHGPVLLPESFRVSPSAPFTVSPEPIIRNALFLYIKYQFSPHLSRHIYASLPFRSRKGPGAVFMPRQGLLLLISRNPKLMGHNNYNAAFMVSSIAIWDHLHSRLGSFSTVLISFSSSSSPSPLALAASMVRRRSLRTTSSSNTEPAR